VNEGLGAGFYVFLCSQAVKNRETNEENWKVKQISLNMQKKIAVQHCESPVCVTHTLVNTEAQMCCIRQQ